MIKRFLKTLSKVAWFIPGFLLWASYPPISERTDVFFALAPLIWFARNRSPRESFKLWFLNGFLFWVGTLAWMPAIVKNGGPWYLVVLGWGALATYCALYFGAFGYLSAHVWDKTKGAYRKRLLAILIAEPVLWAGLEILRSRLMGGFAWNQLGVAAHNSGFGAGSSLGGVYVLSIMVILVNGTIASIAERVLAPWLKRRKKHIELGSETIEIDETNGIKSTESDETNIPRWARSVETILPMLIIFALHSCGKTYIPKYTSENSKSLSVGLIQRNFPCVFKEADKEPWVVYEDLLSRVASKSPDLIVLGESAFSEFNMIGSWQCEEWARWMMKNSNAKGVLGGGCRRDNDATYNSAALYQYDKIDSKKVSLQVYDKVHLVPFGEYIPGDKLIPALQKLAPVGSCRSGEIRLLDFDGIKLGVAICFEDTDSVLIRRFAEMGADALVFITNDSWFSESDETVQHVWQATPRASETALPIIRVGNSGVTGVYYPDGSSWWLGGDKKGEYLLDKPGCGYARVAIPRQSAKILTPYTKYGDKPLLILFMLVLLFAINHRFLNIWYNLRQ